MSAARSSGAGDADFNKYRTFLEKLLQDLEFAKGSLEKKQHDLDTYRALEIDLKSLESVSPPQLSFGYCLCAVRLLLHQNR